MSSIALIEASSSAPSKSKSRFKSLPRSPRARKSPSPISPKRLAANRQNAQKSTGPRTPAGKQKTSQNSLKHALCSQSPRLESECGPTYNIFIEELRESLHPAGVVQEHLFHQLTSILWRLQRANETENQLYALQQRNDDPPCLTLAKAFHKNPTSNPFLLYSRYERHLRNTYLRLLRELKNLQKQDAADTEAAAERRRREPAWSPEKQAAQEARFRAQEENKTRNPDEPEEDLDEDSQPTTRSTGSTADTDWYKAMMQRRFERYQEQRLGSRRQQIEEEERQAAQTPLAAQPPTPPLEVESSTLEVERSDPSTPNEATNPPSSSPQTPSPASESPLPPSSPQNNFDETNPPTPSPIANCNSQIADSPLTPNNSDPANTTPPKSTPSDRKCFDIPPGLRQNSSGDFFNA